jgi:hypothetical protein
MPADGNQLSDLMQRKFEISILRIRAISIALRLARVTTQHQVADQHSVEDD